MTSILISHKLNELAKVADSITVLRDGSTVETIDCRAGQVSESRIIKSMVGREMTERYPRRNQRSARSCSRSATGASSTRSTRAARW